jgi:hypothetical protein
MSHGCLVCSVGIVGAADGWGQSISAIAASARNASPIINAGCLCRVLDRLIPRAIMSNKFPL